MSYIYANNDYQGGTLLNTSNFITLFPFVYFDLTKQKVDMKDGVKVFSEKTQRTLKMADAN